MNTIFIRWDGHRILCPNSKLSADLFTNITRSQKKGEAYKVSPGHPCKDSMSLSLIYFQTRDPLAHTADLAHDHQWLQQPFWLASAVHCNAQSGNLVNVSPAELIVFASDCGSRM